jgi:glycosyltransferase involved in cell wall biosynthesis
VVPVFSVVLPTYGRPAFLSEALASVLGQTFSDFECIVVDDGSPHPPELPDDSRVRLVGRASNGGPAAARNAGIAAAVGRYVAFLDDDDVWLPERLAVAAKAHVRAAVAVCWQSTVGQHAADPSGRLLEGDVRDCVLDAMTPHLGATSIERAVTPNFDERYPAGEDVEWWLRVAQQSAVTTTPVVGLLYRAHAGPRGSAGPDGRLRGASMLLEEYADWFALHPRAKAFRLKRMGISALRVGDRQLARRCFAGSLRLRPEARTAWHALRSLTPKRRTVDA